MQMPKTISSGANWCQQIPGKQMLGFNTLILLKAKYVPANTSDAVIVNCLEF